VQGPGPPWLLGEGGLGHYVGARGRVGSEKGLHTHTHTRTQMHTNLERKEY